VKDLACPTCLKAYCAGAPRFKGLCSAAREAATVVVPRQWPKPSYRAWEQQWEAVGGFGKWRLLPVPGGPPPDDGDMEEFATFWADDGGEQAKLAAAAPELCRLLEALVTQIVNDQKLLESISEPSSASVFWNRSGHVGEAIALLRKAKGRT
jgi:hypothetical protein